MEKLKRNVTIDLLKALAIIAVVFYHVGYLPYGYLGVEVFLMISGYFLMKGYLKSKEKHFGYWKTFFQRIARLWPMIVLAGAVSMLVGIVTMLPDDLENLAESVIASNAFMTNILSMITTKDYWAISNNYRPLMHTWYLGILVQAYFIFPLIFTIAGKFGRRILQWTVAGMILCSIILYLMPFNSAYTFYLLPFRTFEILIGSLVALTESGGSTSYNRFKHIRWLLYSLIVLALMFLCINVSLLNDKIRLIMTVMLVSAIVYIAQYSGEIDSKLARMISYIGKCSFSIFVWHQIILAFYRYIITTHVEGIHVIIYLVFVAVVSLLSYCFVEKKLTVFQKNDKRLVVLLGGTAALCVVTTIASGLLYIKAGVICDVPELNITLQNAYRGMHAEYVDRIYAKTDDFTDSGKTKVLIFGDSMGRDWGNILEESEYVDEFEIYYIHPDQYDSTIHDLIVQEADIVFYATLGDATILPDAMKKVGTEKLYIVGIKNFGECNGNIYSKRFSEHYFDSSIVLGQSFVEGKTYYQQNDDQRAIYGSHYIDMITPIMNEDGSVPVFSDENMFISADCEHLTQAGASYYAKILDLSWIVGYSSFK